MSMLRFILPLRRFQWCRRRLGGRWELWKHWKRRDGGINPVAEWIWVSDEKVYGFMRNVWRPLEVIDVEDYRLTRIDVSHVPEVKDG